MNSCSVHRSLAGTGLLICLSALLLTACGGGSSTPDTTPPALNSASTDATGQNIVLTYNEALSATTAPASAFLVSVNGSAGTAPSSVAVSGNALTLKLATAVTNGQTVLVSYTAPASNSAITNAAVQDTVGNDAASLANSSVTNAVPAPITPAVSIGGTIATPNASGEYVYTAGNKVAIADTQGRLGSVSTSTKDSGGNAVSTSMSGITMTSAQYSVSFSGAPSGSLTTITFSNFSPAFVVKLRWQ